MAGSNCLSSSNALALYYLEEILGNVLDSSLTQLFKQDASNSYMIPSLQKNGCKTEQTNDKDGRVKLAVSEKVTVKGNALSGDAVVIFPNEKFQTEEDDKSSKPQETGSGHVCSVQSAYISDSNNVAHSKRKVDESSTDDTAYDVDFYLQPVVKKVKVSDDHGSQSKRKSTLGDQRDFADSSCINSQSPKKIKLTNKLPLQAEPCRGKVGPEDYLDEFDDCTTCEKEFQVSSPSPHLLQRQDDGVDHVVPEEETHSKGFAADERRDQILSSSSLCVQDPLDTPTPVHMTAEERKRKEMYNDALCQSSDEDMNLALSSNNTIALAEPPNTSENKKEEADIQKEVELVADCSILLQSMVSEIVNKKESPSDEAKSIISEDVRTVSEHISCKKSRLSSADYDNDGKSLQSSFSDANLFECLHQNISYVAELSTLDVDEATDSDNEVREEMNGSCDKHFIPPGKSKEDYFAGEPCSSSGLEDENCVHSQSALSSVDSKRVKRGEPESCVSMTYQEQKNELALLAESPSISSVSFEEILQQEDNMIQGDATAELNTFTFGTAADAIGEKQGETADMGLYPEANRSLQSQGMENIHFQEMQERFEIRVDTLEGSLTSQIDGHAMMPLDYQDTAMEDAIPERQCQIAEAAELTTGPPSDRDCDQTVPSLQTPAEDNHVVDMLLELEDSIYSEQGKAKNEGEQPPLSLMPSLDCIQMSEGENKDLTVPDHLQTLGQPRAGVFEWSRAMPRAGFSPEAAASDTVPWATSSNVNDSRPVTPIRPLPQCGRKRRVGLSRKQHVGSLHARKLFDK